jgi:hypothetical protein
MVKRASVLRAMGRRRMEVLTSGMDGLISVVIILPHAAEDLKKKFR